jgi:hypothetical protein
VGFQEQANLPFSNKAKDFSTTKKFIGKEFLQLKCYREWWVGLSNLFEAFSLN